MNSMGALPHPALIQAAGPLRTATVLLGEYQVRYDRFEMYQKADVHAFLKINSKPPAGTCSPK